MVNLQSYLRRTFDLDQCRSNTGIEPLEYALKYKQLEIFKVLFHLYDTHESHLLNLVKQLNRSDPVLLEDGYGKILHTAQEILSQNLDSKDNSRCNIPETFCMFNCRDRLFRYLRKNPLNSKPRLEGLIDICCTFSSNDCLKLLLNLTEKLNVLKETGYNLESTEILKLDESLTDSFNGISSAEQISTENDALSSESSDTRHLLRRMTGSKKIKPSFEHTTSQPNDSTDEAFSPPPVKFPPEKRKRGRPPKAATQSKVPVESQSYVNGKLPFSLFFKFCRKGNLPKLTKMIPRLTDLNIKNSAGNTALYEASLHGNFEVALLLLSSGADPNISSGEVGNLPLHAACIKGNERMVTLLLTFNSDKNYSNNNGLLPVDVAKSKKIINILDTCTLSIKNDAIENSQGNTVPCVSEKLFLLSFPDTALTYFLQRQTNRVLRKLGGLRKNTYRDLTFRTCSEEEVELLENCQETKEILAKLDRHSVGLIESGEFLHFFHTEYSGRLDTSTLQIEKTSLLLHPHSMPPKMAHKFKQSSQ